MANFYLESIKNHGALSFDKIKTMYLDKLDFAPNIILEIEKCCSKIASLSKENLQVKKNTIVNEEFYNKNKTCKVHISPKFHHGNYTGGRYLNYEKDTSNVTYTLRIIYCNFRTNKLSVKGKIDLLNCLYTIVPM